MSTRVALKSALEAQKVLHQSEWVQDCQHQTLSVPPHLLPAISITSMLQNNYVTKQSPSNNLSKIPVSSFYSSFKFLLLIFLQSNVHNKQKAACVNN